MKIETKEKLDFIAIIFALFGSIVISFLAAVYDKFFLMYIMILLSIIIFFRVVYWVVLE